MEVSWNDSKAVCTTTIHDSIELLHPAKRFSSAETKDITVGQPRLIRNYNQGMGGEDLLDNALSAYRPIPRGKKWHGAIGQNLMYTLLVFSWKFYRHLHEDDENRRISQLDFIRKVVQGLLNNETFHLPSSNPGSIYPLKIFSKKYASHSLVAALKQRRCVVCKKNTQLQCEES